MKIKLKKHKLGLNDEIDKKKNQSFTKEPKIKIKNQKNKD
jgi:hypothetical protein